MHFFLIIIQSDALIYRYYPIRCVLVNVAVSNEKQGNKQCWGACSGAKIEAETKQLSWPRSRLFNDEKNCILECEYNWYALFIYLLSLDLKKVGLNQNKL